MKKIFFFLLVVLGVALLCLLSGRVFPYTFDSMIYISTAENIHRGQGMLCWNFLVEGPTQEYFPAFLQPPGYPILIAFLMLFGLDGYTAGLLVPRLCFLILPFLFYSIFKRMMPSSQAMIGSFVCTFMFPAVKCSMMAWSDIPCLCFSLMALLAVFYVIEKGHKAASSLVFLSGLLAGYVFLIRFVGICLIGCIVLGFIVCWILNLLSKKDFFRIITIYAGGISLVIVPFLFRNWCVFGTIQPCFIPPSQTPLAGNIKDFLGSIAMMLWAEPSMMGLAAFLIIAAVVFIVKKSREMIEREMIEVDKKVFVFTIVLTAYFLVNSIFLIIFQTLRFSAEKINDRYLIQVAWIMMIAVVLAADIATGLLKRSKNLKRAHVAFILLSMFIVVQMLLGKDFLKGQEKTLASSKSIERYVLILRKVPKDNMIITNFPDLVYYHVQRNVRMLSHYTPYDLVKLAASQKKFVIFLVKGEKNSHGDWGKYSFQWVDPVGYTKIFSDQQVDLLVPKI
ncbi:MAG: glycosyltransferase family 39 protein [Candidatus Omnitrophica bacterium]|nr:glycosyltransferase family 39 protein [Candidatus Omnitrophota bacterium]